MEPWEALDLDDSDLPSILRPCKRHLSQQSQLSPDSLSNPNFSSQYCAPTPPPPSADNQPPASLRRLIPGPAGGLQSVMDRVGYRSEDFAKNRDAKICTQDYIRMIEEEDTEEFKSDHWLSALDFLCREGERRMTSLNDIKKCVKTEKIDMVIAMVKSCTPNGLGDLMVVLKDPTDAVHASIHRKVLSAGDYGKQIAVGSVLILQKVSVFVSLNKSPYLNICSSNLVKVIPKDAKREVFSMCTAKDAAPVYHKNSKMPKQVSSGCGRATESNSGIQKMYNSNGREENLDSGSQSNVDQSISKYDSLQPRFTRRDHAGCSVTKKPIEVDLVSFSQEAGIQPEIDLRDEIDVENLDDEPLSAAHASLKQQTQVKERTPIEILSWNFVAEASGQENQNGSGKEKTLSQSRTSFQQQWTDEQLDILDMDY